MVAVAALLVCLSLPKGALGCSCLWAGPFSKVAHGQELIVFGEVFSHYRNSMDVKVTEVIKGAEQRKTIRIWGDNGALCRPYLSRFPIGSRWLLAISPLPEKTIGDPPIPLGFNSPPGDRQYAISVCGDF